MNQYYYSSANGQTYSGFQMLSLFGINVETTDITILNIDGFYLVVDSEPDFDTFLYEPIVSYVISGPNALMTWTPVARPLATAKVNGSWQAKTQANDAVNIEACDCGFSTDLLTGVASQDPVDRATRYQEELDEIAAIASALDSNLTAIETATTVDEINNIVNKPTGLLFTGRGSGLGPEDLNVSYYNAFNSVSMTEAETELYVPSTAITIPYGSGGPNAFDSMGNAFNPGGPYTMQIRETATSMVIAEIEVPLNAAGEDVSF